MSNSFKDKNHKSKKKYKSYKTLTSKLKSVDTVVNIGATTTFVTLSVTGVGLIVVPISAGIACTLSLGNELLRKIISNKYIKYKKQYQKDQKTI